MRVTEDRVRVRLRIGSRIGHEEQFSAMVISGGGRMSGLWEGANNLHSLAAHPTLQP